MLPAEPTATALVLAIVGVLLVTSAMFSRASVRLGIPVLLIFLAIGMLAGSEGIGGIQFEDYHLAYRFGTIGLVLILFDGGFNTSARVVRRVAGPAAVLATFGVLGTAALLAVGARTLLDFSWGQAALLGAVVSSTDAAAVFAVLRSSGVHLQRRVAATLEVESGANDPMAVILTMVVTAAILGQGALGWSVIGSVLLQMGIGAVLGLAIGHGGRVLLARTQLTAAGLYAVLLVGIAFLAFAVPTLVYGSGFLAAYVAGIVLGNARLPYKTSLIRTHDALAWLSQVTMFLMMGLLVFPSRLVEVAQAGVLLAAFLALVARPLVVWLCLLPFRYPAREVAYIGWVGLRGAVPIILASYPVLAGVPGGERIFDVVFFVVVVSAVIPGSTVSVLARKLDLEAADPPMAQAVLQVESRQPLNGEILSFYIDEALPVAGASLADLSFPDGTAVMLLIRGREVIAPKGGTLLLPGDHVYLFARDEDRDTIHLMFGRPVDT